MAEAQATAGPSSGEDDEYLDPDDLAEAQVEAGPSGEGVRKYFYFIKEKVSSDWRDLAFHLGFEHADIDNIAGRNQDDKSCCMDLLEEWLKNNGREATIEVLLAALIKSKLQSTVDGLMDEYPELPSLVPTLPVHVHLDQKISEQLLELARQLITPDVLRDPQRYQEIQKVLLEHKAFLIKLTRGSVVLFLMFLHQTDLDSFYHNHSMIGEGTLSQALTHIIIPDDIQDKIEGDQLTVRLQVKYQDYMRVRERLGQDGRVKKARPVRALPVPPALPAVKPNIDEPLPAPAAGRAEETPPMTEVFQKLLKRYYKLKLTHLKPLIWNDNFTLSVSDIFTHLELIPTRDKQLRIPTEDHWFIGMKGGLRKKISSLDDLFNPDVTGRSTVPRYILIEGEAGVGKTTFLSKEAIDAVSLKTELGRRHDIILLIHLRGVREGETIEEMVLDQCVPQTASVNAQSIRAILQRKESHVLFLLDGYDELRPEAREAGQAIPKLLSGKMYPNSTIVMTSRPSAGVKHFTQPDCHLHITGFTPQHVVQYVRQYFSMISQPEQAVGLLTTLHERPLIADLVQTPMFLLLVCVLWEEDQEIVSTGTMTVLYNNLMTCLIRKHCKQEELDMPTDGLPAEVADALLQLGKLALETLLRNEMLVDLREVEREGMDWELLLKLGVISLEVSASKLLPRKLLNFSHRTMQEFLAGRYVAHALMNEDILELLHLTSITKVLEHSNLLLFTCGSNHQAAQAVLENLGKLRREEFRNLQAEQFAMSGIPIDRDVQKSCKLYERFAKLCFNILHEGRDPEVMHAFSHVLPIVTFDGPIDSREGSTLMYYIQHLRSANLPDRLIVSFYEGSNNRDTVQYLQQCLTTSLPGLKLDLELSGQFGSPDQTARLVSVLENVPGLRALYLPYTELTLSSLQPLVQGFSHMSLLEELDLSGNPELRDAGMGVLQDGLLSVPHLAVLHLRAVGMTPVGMSSLAPYMHHLRAVDISGNAIGDKGLEYLAAKLPLAIKVLKLKFTGISSKGTLALLKVLPHLVELQVLDVSLNNIEDPEIVSLVQALCQSHPVETEQKPPVAESQTTALHNNTTLRELHIGGNRGVTGAGLGRVALLISALPALTWLGMSGHPKMPSHLPESMAMALAYALPRLPALVELDLQFIIMEPVGFQAVVQAAEEHPTLEKLYYSKKLVPEGADTTAYCLELF